MAIDTRNKRASVVALHLPFGRVLPAPDGTIDEHDRAQVAFCYSGLIEVALIVSTRVIRLMRRPLQFLLSPRELTKRLRRRPTKFTLPQP